MHGDKDAGGGYFRLMLDRVEGVIFVGSLK